MKSLVILRHAKSDWGQPQGLPDHDRPLAARGVRTAPLIGAHMARSGWRPDHILCSSATRARQTLELAAGAWGLGDVPTAFERDLYLCGAAFYLQRLRALSPDVERVLLVGHNPDCHDLACRLAGSSEQALRARLDQGFPTGAAARFDIDIAQWPELAPESARLVDLAFPYQFE